MKVLRIISRIYLTLAAFATAVLWFFPWLEVRENIANGMTGINSLMQLFITDKGQSQALDKILSHTTISAFDLEKLAKSLLGMIHSVDGTILESIKDIETARQYLTYFRILIIALVCLAVFFGLRALTNHCFGYILFLLADLASLGAVAITLFAVNDKAHADILEFSYFFYVLIILVVLGLFFWVFAQISGIETNKKKLYVSNSEKGARTAVLIVSVIAFFLCCGAGAALYFII